MPSLTLSQATKVVLVVLAVYFPVALYLHYSYVPKPDPPKSANLTGPFRKIDPTAYQALVPKLEGLADFGSMPVRSTIVLLEDGKPLGPPHSPSKVANGSYSHWLGAGIIFSASDNSDPNSNGRSYSITWK
ncbi:hypothetical protein [Bradyrhizobium cajani]|uniref:Uncharacterized protein n=1 Tax=Bradyrhizobium cajani TaxID=1928661 RepID=A0A844TPP9_9BRAD|nr:hypothetical protein [Bradyrhizobium cajani]MCP3368859.1 hypothetical protein [Bradyrhizobium cajani]MVT76901.1 hypothetical protein [Bradyrhizobium cajani]